MDRQRLREKLHMRSERLKKRLEEEISELNIFWKGPEKVYMTEPFVWRDNPFSLRERKFRNFDVYVQDPYVCQRLMRIRVYRSCSTKDSKIPEIVDPDSPTCSLGRERVYIERKFYGGGRVKRRRFNEEVYHRVQRAIEDAIGEKFIPPRWFHGQRCDSDSEPVTRAYGPGPPAHQ